MIYFKFMLFIIFSSFIKCFIDNKINREFFYRRSKCENCKTVLKIQDLIPFISYILLKGKCRYCNYKLPASLFLYEVFALLVAILFITTSNKFYFITYLDFWILLILIYISIEDIYSYEINPKLQIILLSLITFNVIKDYKYFNFLYSILIVLIYHLIYFLLKKGIGYGDIKLLSILSLNLDFIESINLFLYTFIFAGFFAIYLLITKKANRKSKLALAPYISLSYITLIIIREIYLW